MLFSLILSQYLRTDDCSTHQPVSISTRSVPTTLSADADGPTRACRRRSKVGASSRRGSKTDAMASRRKSKSDSSSSRTDSPPRLGDQPSRFRLSGYDLTVTAISKPAIPSFFGRNHGNHVTRLNVSHGALSDFSGLAQFVALRTLIADHNAATSLQSFPILPALELLSLASNRVADLKVSLSQAHDRFPSLTQLVLKGNPLTPLSTEARAHREYCRQIARRLTKLKLLDGIVLNRADLLDADSSFEDEDDEGDEARGPMEDRSVASTTRHSPAPSDVVAPSPGPSSSTTMLPETGRVGCNSTPLPRDRRDSSRRWGLLWGRRSSSIAVDAAARAAIASPCDVEVCAAAEHATRKLSKGIISQSEYEQIAEVLRRASEVIDPDSIAEMALP